MNANLAEASKCGQASDTENRKPVTACKLVETFVLASGGPELEN
jgi:hypothetical protein